MCHYNSCNYRYCDRVIAFQHSPNQCILTIFFFLCYNSGTTEATNASDTKQDSNTTKNSNEEEEEDEMHSELRFYINGLPIRTTITTRRPMGNIRCVGNSLNGKEPWGAIADFRMYSRAFSNKGSAAWPSELLRPPPTFPAIPRSLYSSIQNGKGGKGRFVDVGSIDNVRKWLVERGTLKI